MNWLFYGVAVLGGLQFVLTRRRVDLFTVGFFSSIVYFLPAFAGFDLLGRPLEPELYLIYSIVLLMLIGASFITQTRVKQEPLSSETIGHIAAYLVAACALVIVTGIIARHGPASLVVHKRESGISGYEYILWRITASLSVLLGLVGRRKLPALVGAISIALMFVAADRTALATAGIAALCYWYQREQSQRLFVQSPLRIVVVLLLGIVLIYGKTFHAGAQAAARTGDVREIKKAFTASKHPTNALIRSEPFATQLVLNEIVRQKFDIGPSHLTGVIYQLWPAPSMLGSSTAEFNHRFQEALFPGWRRESLAYNFWGEGWASGGITLVIMFAFVYVLGLMLFERMCASSHVLWRGTGLLMGVYWAFYIHRNSLASIVAYEKHILYIALIIAAGSAFLSSSVKRPVSALQKKASLVANAPRGTVDRTA